MGVTLVALHGFLGEPADWDRVKALTPAADWIIPDYTRESSLSPQRAGLGVWGGAFASWLERRISAEAVDLIGYSQGGRLALHALEARPALFRRVFIVSAQAGLATDDHDGRAQRLRNDESWARRFEIEDWAETLKAWNSQPVFAADEEEPPRPERQDSRAIAAACLRRWSLGAQRDLRPVLAREAAKIEWIYGGRDSKYAALAHFLQKDIPPLRTVRVPASGHRILFSSPESLSARIQSR